MYPPARPPAPQPAPPVVPAPVPATMPSAPMDHHERMRMRAAAFRATRIYPGPVGELISQELLSFEDFGYRLAGSGMVMRLVDHVLKTAETPEAPASA